MTIYDSLRNTYRISWPTNTPLDGYILQTTNLCSTLTAALHAPQSYSSKNLVQSINTADFNDLLLNYIENDLLFPTTKMDFYNCHYNQQ